MSWGENTTDEMFYLPILSVPYNRGDENIVFEDVSTSTEELETEYFNQGVHYIPVHTETLSPGTYFVKLKTGSFESTTQLIVIR